MNYQKPKLDFSYQRIREIFMQYWVQRRIHPR